MTSENTLVVCHDCLDLDGWGTLDCRVRDICDIARHKERCDFFASARGSEGESIMTRNFRGSLLIASMLIVAWATTSEACHRRRCRSMLVTRRIPAGDGYTYGSPQGYYGGGGGYGMTGGRLLQPGISGRIHPARLLRRPARTGYDFGRPGYNPGGLGGPASGIGVRPGLGAGGLGPGADRSQVLRSPRGGSQAWTFGLTRAGVGGSQLIGAAAGYRAAGGR